MSDEKSKNLHKQQYTIKFCLKLKKMVTDMKKTLDAAYNESAMSQARVYWWYNEFKNGRKSVELIDGQGALWQCNTGTTMIQDDPQLTVRQLASFLDISIGSLHILLLTKLSFSCAFARWISHLLSPQQKTFVLKGANI